MKWYEKAARAGLPEAERFLELISTECDRPSIAGLVIGGQPPRSKWKLAGRGLFLVVILAAVVSISYNYWPRYQQPAAVPENGVVASEQDAGIESGPNLHMDKSSTSGNHVELVHPTTIELDHSVAVKEFEPMAEVADQEIIVDSNTSGRDPNSLSIPESKSRIEELAELADKWLEGATNEKD